MRIAAVQCGVGEGEAVVNTREAVKWIAEAAEAACDLIVLPECALTGYGFNSREELESVALTIDGPEMASVLEICVSKNLHAIVGFFEKAGNKIFNTAALVGPNGLVGCHRKAHLPYLGGDRFADRPEEAAPSVFRTDFGTIGISICYEIRFPEVMRTLVLEGAEIIALPTNWPVQSTILADHFTKVRAAENMVYFVAANRNDSGAGTDYLGRTQIVDTRGNVLVAVDGETKLIFADIDLNAARDKKIVIEEGRFELNLFADRRPKAYRV